MRSSGTDQRHGRAPEVHDPRPFEKFVLETRSGKHDIDGHGRSKMDERHDPCAAYEVEIIDPEDKTSRLHIGRETLRVLGGEPDGNVDVRAQSGHAVSDDRLGPEYVPATPAFKDLRKVRKQLKGARAALARWRSSARCACERILTPVRRMWPAGLLQERLLTQLLGDAKALERPEARDTLAPVLVFGLPRRRPVTGDELANTARNHKSILSCRLMRSQRSKHGAHDARSFPSQF